MSTINFGILVSETTTRHKTAILSGADSIPDVDFITKVRRKLDRGESFTLTPTRLFACSINGVKILIRITVGSNTIELPISSTICVPVEPGQVVVIELRNPVDNTITLPAIIDYVMV